MINVRKIINGDEEEISKIIAKDLTKENIKDYKKEYIDNLINTLNPSFIKKRSEMFHGYVVVDDEKIIGVGMIGPYWSSETESSFFTIFIDPDYKGKGIGRKIIETLEQDIYYKRADRVEIPASITGLEFYRHFGYGFKITNKINGNIVDDEGEYRLEKYPKISYYNNTDTYNIRPYINNEYHNFNEFIYDFIKNDFDNYILFEEYLKNNENNLCIIEYNGKTIGFFNKNELDKIYILDEYSDKNIDKDIKNKVKNIEKYC